jgi:exonuclease-1
MGIPGLFPFLQKKVPSAFQPLALEPALGVEVKEWRGVRLGIDFPILLHCAKSSDSTPFVYLAYIAERVLWLRGLGAEAVFVFDGAHPVQKKEEGDRRGLLKSKAETKQLAAAEQIHHALDEEAFVAARTAEERYARASTRVSSEDREWAWRLLEALGARCIVAPGEAEAMLVLLQRAGAIDEIVTEDSDALVGGAHSLIRNFWRLARPALSSPVSRVSGTAVLEGLKLTPEAFVVMCVLAGCDFAPKLAGVGVAKAHKAVLKHGADLSKCLVALGRADVAESPQQLERFTTAAKILSPPASSAQLQDVCWATPCPVRWAALLQDAEAAGEPHRLRETAVFQQGRKRMRMTVPL